MKTLLAAVLTAATMLALKLPAEAVTYGGDATGAEVTVTATGTTIRAATGSLSISGGMADAALLVGDIPSSATAGAVALSASALHSAVVGTGDNTKAEASMGAIGLTVSGNTFSADFLMARSNASCPTPAVSGSSELANLVINGQTITVTGSPNQTVSLPNGTAIINAQTSTVGGTSAELAVTALRVLTHDTVTGQPIADVLLTTVDAKVDCSGGTSNTEEWVTGGGWIPNPPSEGGGKATFGFVAGRRADGTERGHFTFKNHGEGESFHGSSIFGFAKCATPGGPSSFQATDDTQSSDAIVEATDNDSQDTIHISIQGTTQYDNLLLQALGGGNIRNHGFPCP